MREISCCAKFPREFYRRAIASNTSLSVMNSLSEHIILVFMLKLFVSVLEHLCTNDNVHFHIASSHVITQIEYALVLFSMFASRNILNRKTNSVGIEKNQTIFWRSEFIVLVFKKDLPVFAIWTAHFYFGLSTSADRLV